VARSEVLQRNIPKDWSIKDWTSCKKTLYLERKDDVAKMMQVKWAKCKMARGPTRVRRDDRTGLKWAWASRPRPAGLAHLDVGSPPPISWAWRWCNPKSVWAPPFTGESHSPRGLPQAREEGEERDHSRGGLHDSKEATTSGGGRRGPATTQLEEKEDTVGSVTMINDAMFSALMG
jgi:hypothetical protein